MCFDLQGHAITFGCAEPLGIIDANDACATCTKHHGGSVNRTCEWPATGFVNAAAVHALISKLRENGHREAVVTAIFWRA